MTAYYNEFDPYAAQWLRNLIDAGLIPHGDVDERSIVDVAPSDLAGYTQCHFFAGIGVWSYALRLAGWSDDRPVWTGSCPCQPFSTAGKGAGFDDERHLWPAFHHLIKECHPPIVFGEQVASPDGLKWLDLVHADMEATGYAFGAADLCAAGVGAPHIRQRLYWVADSTNQRQHGRRTSGESDGRNAARVEPERLRNADRMADNDQHGCSSLSVGSVHNAEYHAESCGGAGGLADAAGGRNFPSFTRADQRGFQAGDGGNQRCAETGPTNGHWRAADWLACRDGKWRPVEPGTFPLAHGVAARVGRLRAYGNAIVPQVAAEVIGAYMEFA